MRKILFLSLLSFFGLGIVLVGFFSIVTTFNQDKISTLRKHGYDLCYQAEMRKIGALHPWEEPLNVDATKLQCGCGGAPFKILFHESQLSLKDGLLVRLASVWHGFLGTGCPSSGTRPWKEREVEQFVQVLVRLFFVIFVVLIPALMRGRSEKRQVAKIYEKALQIPERGINFLIGFNSEVYFKKFSKFFALEGAGRLSWEREAVLFEGSTAKEETLEMRFFSKVAKVTWIGRSLRNGRASWFQIEQNGKRYFFTSDSILKGFGAFGTHRSSSKRLYEEVLKKLGDPLGR